MLYLDPDNNFVVQREGMYIHITDCVGSIDCNIRTELQDPKAAIEELVAELQKMRDSMK